ncbi:MAG TPA: methionine--tRNA ligase, partial [Candidatus Aenigmarchaeota archaeon]|nr:methionine--tRNA ligase [Candidatus Aenigmarchaeota archaeon]
LTDTLFKIHKKIYDWFKISYDNFSRTSREIHHKTTQEFFLRIYKNGFISEGELKLPFCPSCKRFLPDRYVEGVCPYCGYDGARGDQCEKCGHLLDPDELRRPRCAICGSKPEFKITKHLFLRLDKLQSKLEKWIKSNEHWKDYVVSLALGWIKEGLKKRCITRDLKWGVKVPLKGYENKVFYVWFDAPIGYISSTKEWAIKVGKPKEWEKFWKDPKARIYNFLGKDNIPFHTIFWPGMLIAHGDFNLPYQVVGLNYCNYEGGKISKSRGWGIFCDKMLEAGIDVDIWRYYLIHLIPETKDTEFKWKEFEDRINNELVANIGNFVYRTLSFVWKNFDGILPSYEKLEKEDEEMLELTSDFVVKIEKFLEDVRIRDALSQVVSLSVACNKYFQQNQPWKNLERARVVVNVCINICKTIAVILYPFLPSSSEKLWRQLNLSKSISWEEAKKFDIRSGHRIKKPEILFKKIEKKDIERLKKVVTKVTPLEEIFKVNKITINDFKRVEMKVGTVVEVEDIKGSTKLYKLKVDFGDGKLRQAVAGLKPYYKKEEIKEKQFVFVTNLQPKRIMGEIAEVMILAAVKGGKVSLIKPDKKVENGARLE